MATPYFQYVFDSVPSTQDLARARLEHLPVLVVAAAQTEGRGRTGSTWKTAPRAFAASYAFRHEPGEERPLSLMAGIAATRFIPDVKLKWPNDVQRSGQKLGGILVERTGDETVVGFGLNLFWPDPPDGMGAVFADDPGEESVVRLATRWAAELAQLIAEPGWPRDEYKAVCDTLGQEITWEPRGRGRVLDVLVDGSLEVSEESGVVSISSGAVRHVRPG